MPEERIEDQPQTLRSRLLDRHVFFLLLVAVVTLFSRFFRPNGFGYFEDDFFYYVQVAQNFARHGVSTFDGTHLTNGYHPLWFLVLAALLTFTSGTVFLVAVQILTIFILLAVYLLAGDLLQVLGVRHSLLRGLSLLLSLQILLLFRYGMEITLAIPLGMATLVFCLRPGFRWTTSQTLIYGLLACLTTLGRLDNILLFALLLPAQLLASPCTWPDKLRRVAGFCVGFSPFLLYLASNQIFFGVWMPVSGSAKQLKPLLPLSLAPVMGMLVPPDWMKAVFVYPDFLLLLVAAALLMATWQRLAPQQRAILTAFTLFPVLHLATLSVLSDWTVWPWYYYTLVYSTIACAVLLSRPVNLSPRIARPAIAIVAILYAVFFLIYSVKRKPSITAEAGADLALYMRSHPGIYAMGDGAGAPAYLSGQPVVQLEGLTMDKTYLQAIRAAEPLQQALRERNVDYYILYRGTPANPQPCTALAEPGNAGALSPHLRGNVCTTPLFRTVHRGITASIYRASDIQ